MAADLSINAGDPVYFADVYALAIKTDALVKQRSIITRYSTIIDQPHLPFTTREHCLVNGKDMELAQQFEFNYSGGDNHPTEYLEDKLPRFVGMFIKRGSYDTPDKSTVATITEKFGAEEEEFLNNMMECSRPADTQWWVGNDLPDYALDTTKKFCHVYFTCDEAPYNPCFVARLCRVESSEYEIPSEYYVGEDETPITLGCVDPTDNRPDIIGHVTDAHSGVPVCKEVIWPLYSSIGEDPYYVTNEDVTVYDPNILHQYMEVYPEDTALDWEASGAADEIQWCSSYDYEGVSQTYTAPELQNIKAWEWKEVKAGVKLRMTLLKFPKVKKESDSAAENIYAIVPTAIRLKMKGRFTLAIRRLWYDEIYQALRYCAGYIGGTNKIGSGGSATTDGGVMGATWTAGGYALINTDNNPVNNLLVTGGYYDSAIAKTRYTNSYNDALYTERVVAGMNGLLVHASDRYDEEKLDVEAGGLCNHLVEELCWNDDKEISCCPTTVGQPNHLPWEGGCSNETCSASSEGSSTSDTKYNVHAYTLKVLNRLYDFIEQYKISESSLETTHYMTSFKADVSDYNVTLDTESTIEADEDKLLDIGNCYFYNISAEKYWHLDSLYSLQTVEQIAALAEPDGFGWIADFDPKKMYLAAGRKFDYSSITPYWDNTYQTEMSPEDAYYMMDNGIAAEQNEHIPFMVIDPVTAISIEEIATVYSKDLVIDKTVPGKHEIGFVSSSPAGVDANYPTILSSPDALLLYNSIPYKKGSGETIRTNWKCLREGTAEDSYNAIASMESDGQLTLTWTLQSSSEEDSQDHLHYRVAAAAYVNIPYNNDTLSIELNNPPAGLIPSWYMGVSGKVDFYTETLHTISYCDRTILWPKGYSAANEYGGIDGGWCPAFIIKNDNGTEETTIPVSVLTGGEGKFICTTNESDVSCPITSFKGGYTKCHFHLWLGNDEIEPDSSQSTDTKAVFTNLNEYSRNFHGLLGVVMDVYPYGDMTTEDAAILTYSSLEAINRNGGKIPLEWKITTTYSTSPGAEYTIEHTTYYLEITEQSLESTGCPAIYRDPINAGSYSATFTIS